MEFMTFDCQKFSTHTRKFLLHKCNLYAHFEGLESSSLLGQGMGAGEGEIFPSNHLSHSSLGLQSDLYLHYFILLSPPPCKRACCFSHFTDSKELKNLIKVIQS